MTVFATTDIGKVREHNEDSYIFRQVREDIVYGIVCDGMGGVKGGKIASKTVIDTMSEILDQCFEIEEEPYQIRNILKRAVKMANEAVYKLAQQDSDISGMGTTMVIAIVIGNDLFVANVGDSRAYLCYNNSVEQISVDHSVVQQLVDSGQITKEEAGTHPQKNIITRAIGVGDYVEFDFYTYSFLEGDSVLLCSDGLSNYCSEEILQSILTSENSIEKQVHDLIDHANKQGGRDNVTALLIKHD